MLCACVTLVVPVPLSEACMCPKLDTKPLPSPVFAPVPIQSSHQPFNLMHAGPTVQMGPQAAAQGVTGGAMKRTAPWRLPKGGSLSSM